MDQTELSKFGKVRKTNNYIIVSDESLKKALIMKKSVHLEDATEKYGELKTRIFSQEECKKRHMGKIKCVVEYSNDQELEQILQAYFS
ncbi:MAG: hypothetical protein PHF86_02795 [Candidatus Nanoarchaeia archaeon]|jgi:hypothetical protein|nr:hypothetical protein [Candidatus Nanoarchaeia archaeon]